MATQGRDAPPLHGAFPLASFHVGSAGPGAGPGPGGGGSGVMGSSQDVQGQGSPSVPEAMRLRRFSDRSDLEGQPGQRMASETSGSATELATLAPLGPPGPSFPRRRPVR